MGDSDLLKQIEITKYSVLMSIYKKENPQFFAKAIDSMMNQTFEPDQIVLVEDGPLTSDLSSLILEYKQKLGERLTLVINKENLGLGRALNKGLNACRNDLVARMDTDDISAKDRCEKEIRFLLKHPDVVMVGTWVYEFSGNLDQIISIRKVPIKYDDIVKFSKRRNPFNHPSVMYKKNVILKENGYSSLRYGQDYELFGRLIIHGNKVANIPEPLVYFRTDSGAFNRRKNKLSIKCYLDTIKEFKKLGHSSQMDYLYVWLTQRLIQILPTGAVKFAYKIMRR